jgi:ribonuclease HII
MIGIDEVGRGCWAGPLLVVAARERSELPKGLNDSKLLTKQKRESAIAAIEASCDLGEGWVEPEEVDKLGLTAAMQLGVQRALTAIHCDSNEEIIMDGHINYCNPKYSSVSCVVRADSLHPIVSAASIYAKVLRDAKMAEFAVDYPDYGFEKHVGYGTKQHQEALRDFGVTMIHRRSYKPIKALL